MFANGKSFHILKNKRLAVEFGDKTHKFKHKAIPRVIECPVPNHRKALARRSPEYAINLPCADARCYSYV